jgi:acyl-CoA synthetase (NDP forming)
MLLEPDAARLLADCGIPYVEHGVATTASEAVETAARLGLPVVLKVVSPDIVHKTEVGGVLTRLENRAAVRKGFDQLLGAVRSRCPDARISGVLVARHVDVGRELIVGAVYDATFGPTVIVGLGGVLAEVLTDVACRLTPLTQDDALDMLHALRGHELLTGFRGEEPVDLETAAGLLVKIGDLFVSHPEIAEIDLNPVLASAHGCVALDARIILRGSHSDVLGD